jgi:hypothetical protein
MTRLQLIVAASLGLVGAAHAAEDRLWILEAGVDVDTDGGTIVAGRLGVLPTERLSLFADAGRSDSKSGDVDFTANYAALRADYAVGPVGVTAGTGWYDSDGVADRFRYGGSVYVTGKGFLLELTAEDWHSEFDTYEFEGEIDRPNLPPLQVSTTADCELDNRAFGVSGGWTGERLQLAAGLREYDYERADCRLAVLVDGREVDLDRLAGSAPRLARAIAQATQSAARLRILASDAGFLDRSVWLGAAWRRGAWLFGLEYLQTTDAFLGLDVDTAYGRAVYEGSNRYEIELRLGASDGDDLDTVAFTGVSAVWFLP